MIPARWKIISLEKVAVIQTGLAKGKKGLKNVIKLPYIRVANVQDGYLDLSEIKEIEVDSNQVTRYLLQNEDILLTEGGDFDKLGRGSIWNCQIDPCLHQNHIFVVRTNRENLIPHFLSYQINSCHGKAYFLSCAKQTTNLATINSTQLKEFPVLLPPIAEQRKIAEILGAWDESIALLEKLITAKRKLKQGLMQQLLTGKKRFKEFEGSEWKTVSIEEIAFVDRRSLRSNTPEYYTFRYISLSDINNGEISKDLPEICFAEAPSRARKLVSNNDIIMATVRPNLKAFSIIKSDADKYVVSTGFAVITTKKGYSADYLYQYIFSDRIEKQINALVTGSNYPAINSSEIKQLSVYCPSFPEQEKIASVLSATDTEISTLEKQLAAYKQQKRGLMQQLLTGKTRVNVN